ncbi:molybdopterin cofactor-binding domain-containing protein [Actinomycetes bacterium KLBMP 9759]
MRGDVEAKLRGEHLYPSDLRPDGALWVAAVRAPHPHATITGVDTAAALAAPGVVAVLTARDVPGVNGFGLLRADQPVLCDIEVRFAGDVVAVVAAESRAQAYAARLLVHIAWEALPLVTDPAEGAVCGEVELGHGDLEAGFAAADVVVDYAYRTGRQEHAFIETEAGVSYIAPDGRLTVSAGSQNPHSDQRQICAALDLPAERVHVLNPMMGGAFGGKEDISVQILLALVTHHTGRSARFVLERAESLAFGMKRHPFDVRIRAGATTSGELTAFDVAMLADTGAYLTIGPAVLTLAAELAGGPYRYRSSRVVGKVVHTNNGNSSAFRGFGSPQIAAGHEQVIDMLALRLGIDPLELRRRNTLTRGDRAAAGFTLAHDVELGGPLASASAVGLLTEADAWRTAAAPGKRRGIGVAAAWQPFGLGEYETGAEAWAERTAEGRWRISVSCPDLGQGNVDAFARIAAEVFGCAPTDVEVVHGDSDAPDAESTNASRTISVVGNAVAEASALLLEKLRDHEEPLRVSHHYQPKPPMSDTAGLTPHASFTPSLLVVGLEVDVHTGEVDVRRMEHHIDPGRVIDATGVRGQSEGALVQGLGFALMEDTIVHEGNVLTDRFANYLVPTVLDAPAELRTLIISGGPDPSNPLGVRGVGEIGIAPVAPAIANALHDAIGERFAQFPVTPDAVLAALDGRNG